MDFGHNYLFGFIIKNVADNTSIEKVASCVESEVGFRLGWIVDSIENEDLMTPLLQEKEDEENR